MNHLRVLATGVKPRLRTRIWHRLQERVRHPRMRSALAHCIALMRPKALLSASESQSAELRRDGIVMFREFMSASEAEDIQRALQNLPCTNPWKPKDGTFAADAPPPGTHIGHILQAPAVELLHRYANDPRLIALASDYFGCRPILDSIQAWWSFSGNDEPEEAENFHRDNDSIRFLKFFLYVTDVTAANGPHVFVKGTHVRTSLLDKRRFKDEEIYAHHDSDVLTITGKAGDAFIEDTYGLHKGQLPQRGTRLLVQFRYSITESIFRSPIVTEPSKHQNPRAISSLVYEQ